MNGYELSEGFTRHVILNSIRNVKSMHSTYKDVVICCDSKESWRKQIYPYYKAKRRENRDEGVDWETIFGFMETVKGEIAEVFPWRVVEVPQCEADDIIAIAAKRCYPHTPVMIVSSDKDFRQLQTYRKC